MEYIKNHIFFNNSKIKKNRFEKKKVRLDFRRKETEKEKRERERERERERGDLTWFPEPKGLKDLGPKSPI